MSILQVFIVAIVDIIHGARGIYIIVWRIRLIVYLNISSNRYLAMLAIIKVSFIKDH